METEVEQVGFIETAERTNTLLDIYDLQKQKLIMMDGELCINASLAYACSLRIPKGQLFLNNDSVVDFTNQNDVSSIRLNLPYKRFVSKYAGNEYVLFQDIGYEVGLSIKEAKRRKDQLSKLCKEFALPAFGFIVTKPYLNEITPLIYVDSTKSTIWETVCGSGSIAAYIVKSPSPNLTDYSLAILQPTGMAITIKEVGKQTFEVSANVKRIS